VAAPYRLTDQVVRFSAGGPAWPPPARVRHEPALCLALIGAVLVADPDWPLRLAEPVWWALFSKALSAYVVVRRRICG